MNKKNRIIIAVDGPAASGKGTLSKLLAKNFGFAHMDSGKLYRVAALYIIENRINPKNQKEVLQNIGDINFYNLIGSSKLLSDEVGKIASIIANYKSLRDHLLKIQRDFVYIKNKDKLGVIIDGRDIGTVVLPEANIKFFITATLETRIERRCKELLSLGYNIIKRHVEQEMRNRDQRDKQRTHSPLLAARDAILLDTTNLEVEASYALAKKHIEVYLG
tara:strand:+ start:609 stop:1265 length:657 start_codon:yes stop_codon:yes gene_type:complete